MIKCVGCGGNAETPTARAVNLDYDMACSAACQSTYETRMAAGLRAICGTDQELAEWLDPGNGLGTHALILGPVPL